MVETLKVDSDYIFYELTQSIRTNCLETINAHILVQGGRVIMRKRCTNHGWFEVLIRSDAEMYLNSLRYNKSGTIPIGFSTDVCTVDRVAELEGDPKLAVYSSRPGFGYQLNLQRKRVACVCDLLPSLPRSEGLS